LISIRPVVVLLTTFLECCGPVFSVTFLDPRTPPGRPSALRWFFFNRIRFSPFFLISRSFLLCFTPLFCFAAHVMTFLLSSPESSHVDSFVSNCSFVCSWFLLAPTGFFPTLSLSPPTLGCQLVFRAVPIATDCHPTLFVYLKTTLRRFCFLVQSDFFFVNPFFFHPGFFYYPWGGLGAILAPTLGVVRAPEIASWARSWFCRTFSTPPWAVFPIPFPGDPFFFIGFVSSRWLCSP